MPHMRKNLAIRMANTPESPFTARLKEVAEALGLFCHSELPDDALDKRSREDAWNGKLGTKHKHVARSLYDGLWKAAGGAAVIGWSGAIPARFKEQATYNKKALELLGPRDSFIALAEKQFKEGGRRKSCGNKTGNVQPEPPVATTPKKSEAMTKVKHAQELTRGGKAEEGIKEMEAALAIARAAGNDEEEVEVLIALALTSSERKGRGDRPHYLQEAEKKVSSIKSPVVKVIFFRARGAALQEARNVAGAEEAYRAALRLCDDEQEDKKSNFGTQGCIVRSSLVHLLCNLKRMEDARPLLEQCEAYAKQHREFEEGELFQAALEAGIHYCLTAGDEDGAVARVAELESFCTTARLANRIGGAIINAANHASHSRAHKASLAAAEAAVRLGRRFDIGPASGFLLGALYTEAMVLLQAGEDEKALPKGEAVLALCNLPEQAMIKKAAQQLIGKIRRAAGDSESAVELARQALAAVGESPEDVSFSKMALARALNDDGQTEEALKQAREAWALVRPLPIPSIVAADFLARITNFASQLGAETELAAAVEEFCALPADTDEVKSAVKKAHARVLANRQLRHRFIEVLNQTEPALAAGTQGASSLAEANAIVVQPLFNLSDDAEHFAGAYDFWGRGNFGRVLLNARTFPNSFNVTLEVRTLADVKKAVRPWGLYADLLILLWKGPTLNAMTIIAVPEDYESPGGWGYTICARDELKKDGSNKKWHPTLAVASLLPDEVATFLATEARPFLQAGRLFVVPALGAGCINPGHGPFEQLLAEAANAIPSIRWKGVQGTPIGFVPYSPNAPFEVLAEVVETESSRLRKLRLLLLRRSLELKPDGALAVEAKALSLEIEDALRDFEDRNSTLARKKGLEKAKEPLNGSTARFKSNGRKLADATPDSPFAPLLILQSLGYGWRVDGPQILKLPPRFEPQQGDVIGTWLAPPKPGWVMPTVQVVPQRRRKRK